ncbi:camp-dependent protein kinase regulatory subunit [Hysterangium stoloniferum]|nr:camp-dependent protein kinase regulatory subunit [Hysterangium stoloniferum]
MSIFEQLIADLTRDFNRVQPKDTLQYCSNWFQHRLEEQRARMRDTLAGRSSQAELPIDHITDAVLSPVNDSLFNTNYTPGKSIVPPLNPPSQSRAVPSFPGTLNVPGNALLTNPPLTFPDDDSGNFLRPPMSSLGRRVSVSAESGLVPDQELDEPTPVFPKSDEQVRRIKASISRNFLFRDLNEEQESGVLAAMQETKVSAGHVVIRQGDDGNFFYIVEEGLLYCYIQKEEALPTLPEGDVAENFTLDDQDPRFGQKVAVCKPNDSFGELALMYNHPRAATVVAVEASTLWQLDRITFRKIVTQIARRRRRMYEEFLKGVPILSPLSLIERSKIADVLTSEQYADGEAVVKQGDPGDTFYFVEEGEAIITKKQQNEKGEWEEVELGTYTKGDYFGELALLGATPRAATVRAVHRKDTSAPRLKCARLGAAAFTRLLGPLREIMVRKAGESYSGYR